MSDPQTTPVDSAEKAFAAASESVAVSKPAAKIQTVSFPPKAARAPAGASPVVSPAVSPKASSVAPKAVAVSPKAPKKVAAKKAAPAKAKKPVVAKQAASAKKPAAAATVHQFPSLSQIKDQTMTKTNEVTEGVKKFAGEAQDKAKAAIAKGKVVLADAGAFTKGNVDAIVESGKILGKGVKALGEEAIADTRTAFETVSADVKAAVAVKSPAELVKLQGDIARRNLDTVVSTTRKNGEALVKLANDVFAPLSARFTLAVEKVKKAA